MAPHLAKAFMNTLSPASLLASRATPRCMQQVCFPTAQRPWDGPLASKRVSSKP